MSSLFNVFSISGSAVSAQAKRLNVVASNLANADAVAGPDGKPYMARQVTFEPVPVDGDAEVNGVRVSGVTETSAPVRRVHEPGNPLADADGYVNHSNVNVVDEMVNMISASRSYQNNVEVMNTARQLLAKTLQMGQ
ncbi:MULTISPECIES: flagellar basal body rod protein FlgC [Ramlibacter]|uniref:Flagellar basal-body rod protein FlgC n=1 Tax=Ramlibacter aquaticus TaxID=2780094 RepID=A0ABR9SI16_9BURK|nr:MULTISPECIES: flagellar basal body rod protein FlgC [Ramlibacter]MBE7941539.1 flagellar basal body rod protein FlgC [Ramlibacter aquaticus]